MGEKDLGAGGPSSGPAKGVICGVPDSRGRREISDLSVGVGIPALPFTNPVLASVLTSESSMVKLGRAVCYSSVACLGSKPSSATSLFPGLGQESELS